MSRLERRLLAGALTLTLLAYGMWMYGGANFFMPTAHACVSNGSGGCLTLAYYGADLGTGMQVATGVGDPRFGNFSGLPWPQSSGNYCFLAAVQAVTNYADWNIGYNPKYPSQFYQGPATNSAAPGDPSQEIQGQILSDMDTVTIGTYPLVANFSPGQKIVNNYGGSGPQYRRPFTLANIAHDGGGDPRAVAVTTWYETPNNHYYHQYIYHYSQSNVSWAVAGFAYAVDAYKEPISVVVNGGQHLVVVAGVWSYGDPITNFPATIDSIAVYNPWNQGWGSYLNGAYYSRVSYSDWVGASYQGSNMWWSHGYDWTGSGYANTTYDPDPYMGIYQAGKDPVTGINTSNPNAHHWVGWFVDIERDSNSANYNPNYSYNENDQAMTGP